MKNYSALYLPISTFNPPTFEAPSFSYWHYNDRGVWSDSRLFNGMRLVIIVLLLIWLSWVWLIFKTIYFTHKLHIWVIGVAIKTCYYSHKFHFYRFDLFPRQFTSLMNCILGFTIHLGYNIVMTAGSSSHKSRYICHFRIITLSRGIIF